MGTKQEQFGVFYKRIESELLTHRVITHNSYTAWWAKGEANSEQVKAFVTQFSVFSNLFIHAQLQKMIHADSVEAMRASKEILLNELGVIFKPKKAADAQNVEGLEWDKDSDLDLVSTEGTVEGGTFRFSAAHFEWLVRMAGQLGLGFNDIGKRRHGIASTLFFCDELFRLYGSDDYETSQAASFAIENWATAGFWKQLILGLKKFKERECPKLPIGFFTYHDRLEDQHAKHTQEELRDYYLNSPSMNEDKFIQKGKDMLNAVAAFWDGLDNQRKLISAQTRLAPSLR